MSKSSITNLLNAEIDGELTHAQAEQLKHYLRDVPEARIERDELVALADLLNATPDIAPPPLLHQQIMNQVTLPRAPLQSDKTSAQKRWYQVTPLPIGFAFAAGMILALGLIQFGPAIDSQDADQMVGTITQHHAETPPIVLDSVTIENSDIKSQASLLERNNRILMLELSSYSTRPVDISIKFANSRLASGSGSPLQSSLKDVRSITLESLGQKHFSLFLQPSTVADATDRGEAVIELKYFIDGEQIRSVILSRHDKQEPVSGVRD